MAARLEVRVHPVGEIFDIFYERLIAALAHNIQCRYGRQVVVDCERAQTPGRAASGQRTRFSHCHNCGSQDGHWARDCPKPKQPPCSFWLCIKEGRRNHSADACIYQHPDKFIKDPRARQTVKDKIKREEAKRRSSAQSVSGTPALMAGTSTDDDVDGFLTQPGDEFYDCTGDQGSSSLQGMAMVRCPSELPVLIIALSSAVGVFRQLMARILLYSTAPRLTLESTLFFALETLLVATSRFYANGPDLMPLIRSAECCLSLGCHLTAVECAVDVVFHQQVYDRTLGVPITNVRDALYVGCEKARLLFTTLDRPSTLSLSQIQWYKDWYECKILRSEAHSHCSALCPLFAIGSRAASAATIQCHFRGHYTRVVIGAVLIGAEMRLHR